MPFIQSADSLVGEAEASLLTGSSHVGALAALVMPFAFADCYARLLFSHAFFSFLADIIVLCFFFDL